MTGSQTPISDENMRAAEEAAHVALVGDLNELRDAIAAALQAKDADRERTVKEAREKTIDASAEIADDYECNEDCTNAIQALKGMK